MLRPAAWHKQVREAVELQVSVEEDHGQLGRLQLAENERRLHGDGVEAEILAALRTSRPKRVGWQKCGLAADTHALARANQSARLALVVRGVDRDADEVVVHGVAKAAH